MRWLFSKYTWYSILLTCVCYVEYILYNSAFQLKQNINVLRMPFHFWKSFYDNDKPVLYLICLIMQRKKTSKLYQQPSSILESLLVMTKRQNMSEFLRLQRTKCRTCSYSVKCNVTFSLSSMSIPEDILREKNVIQFASDILRGLRGVHCV